MFHTYVASVLSGCCVCFTMGFQVFFRCFCKCFRRMFQMFHLSSFACCNYCICRSMVAYKIRVGSVRRRGLAAGALTRSVSGYRPTLAARCPGASKYILYMQHISIFLVQRQNNLIQGDEVCLMFGYGKASWQVDAPRIWLQSCPRYTEPVSWPDFILSENSIFLERIYSKILTQLTS